MKKQTYQRILRLSEPIEDKLFFICKASTVFGEVRSVFEGGKNQWMTRDDLLKEEKHFKSAEWELAIYDTDTWLIEKTVTYSPDVF
jgi:hypothetical protein